MILKDFKSEENKSSSRIRKKDLIKVCQDLSKDDFKGLQQQFQVMTSQNSLRDLSVLQISFKYLKISLKLKNKTFRFLEKNWIN